MIDAISNAMNVCTFVFETSTIITMMPMARPNSILVDSSIKTFLLSQ